MLSFKEVFPRLRLSEDVSMYLNETSVKKITESTTGLEVRVYIYSKVLIPKEYVIEAEKAIEKQVFGRKGSRVRVLDRYVLEHEYTPEELYEEYKSSIRIELETYFQMIYRLYKQSEIYFTERGMEIKLPSGFISESYGEELEKYFVSLFLNRFNIHTEVYRTYKETSLDKYKESKEDAINRRLQQIEEKLRNSREDKKEEDTKALEEKKKKKEAAETYKNNYNKSKKSSNSSDLLYGRDFDGDDTRISNIDERSGNVVINGMIRTVEEKPIKNEKTILKFAITDFEDTISSTLFVQNDKLPEIKEVIKKGNFVRICGDVEYNKYEQDVTLSRIIGIKKSSDKRVKREDHADVKRVELHCHTKMSDMDGVSYAKDIINKAVEWGHKAIAITDHGVVQSFPDCMHTAEGKDIKIIYGVEAYIVNDDRQIARNEKGQGFEDEFVVFDLETTGFSAHHDKIIEIGAVKIRDGQIVDRFSEFVNPEKAIPFKIQKLTSITDAMVKNAETIEQVLPRFLEFIGDSVLVAHNAEFDVSFITDKALSMGVSVDNTVVDTVFIAQYLIPGIKNYKLDTLVKHLNVELLSHHRAVDDAEATAGIFLKMKDMLKERDIFTLKKLNEVGKISSDTVKKLHPYHACILATSEEGKYNLYRMISNSHIENFYRVPKIPKSVLNKYREGVIVGSACEAGELYQAILSGRSSQVIANIVNYYDYLEIMPVGNNEFLIENEDSFISSVADLQEINKRIVSLGEQFKKPVVATGDVHFLNPEDKIFRSVIQAGAGFKDADRQPPLYLKTTEEMLEEFSYLGEDKAFEVVVENTNKIADMCDTISPVRPDKCPPVIENSDEMLRKICLDRAHEIYGEDLPEIVSERLERELNSIISNGYSVMYIIAQKLVWKSNDDGFLVGSRGSVGSSFAATMAGITEVNPLPPHYVCPKCHYSDFESETVKEYEESAGCDMPDQICPKCGEKLEKNGFNIPFETFLGFKGNKEPDIDLNFSNEYQSKAHAFTEVIFGKGQTFKAGTIGTVAEKTAFGYAKGYFEAESEKTGKQIIKRKCEIERIAQGCVDVRRTTGQHPGGIVVLPIGEDINTFTPVQRPANDMKSTIITTHFDYHSIDHNLLKLDILGHLDPTMIRKLQDLTGIDPLTIPLDSKEVMSLFKNTDVLKLKPEQIGGTELGTLGVPEFGTDFAMGMLQEAKPERFSDLVRIAGLAHGTDVWLGNTQELLREGTATISTAICTRDDIMVYLISMGLDKELSFTIMESVRKGKGLKNEWEEEMKAHNVPDWYIWSCKKIKYMFPKAHAAAYVMMAWRVAYFKVFYPLEYYCAYFSIRASAFDYEMMACGEEKLKYYIADYRKRSDSYDFTDAEKAELKDMRIVEEMYARGFEFTPIDIYKAQARSFQIVDGKIMPSFKVISKVGEVVGESIEVAAKDGVFLSKEDIQRRAKVGKTAIEKLSSLGILDGFTESNQLSFFDM